MKRFLLLLAVLLGSIAMSAQIATTKEFDVTESPNESEKTITVCGHDKKVSFKMIQVKSGTFKMGGEVWEMPLPLHDVTLTKNYYIGETEVTQDLWYAIMGQKPTVEDDEKQWKEKYGIGDKYPAYCISYEDCMEFVAKLNQETGLHFRLPTEAEWEYAARGGHKMSHPNYVFSGSNEIDEVAWFNENSMHAIEVKKKKPNELGLYDMSGNLWELCLDWYEEYNTSPQTDPFVSDKSGPYSKRVVRGDSFKMGKSSSVAARFATYPNSRGSDVGVRLVLDEK